MKSGALYQRAPQQIVGREPRKRSRNLLGAAQGVFDSRCRVNSDVEWQVAGGEKKDLLAG